MKVLMCHNFYQQAGGEDQVFRDEANLLKSHGHEVVLHSVHNDAISSMGRMEVALKTLWNRTSYREVRNLLRTHRPDVVHFTNTFPLISPAAYYAAQDEKVPVVQSLHNYRLVCPEANLFRDQSPCEACVGRSIPWPALVHSCYRSDRLATGVVVSMTVLHRLMKTWKKCVDRFIALSDFSAEKFIRGGLPADKLVVKRNFIDSDPGQREGAGGYAVFVGRLTPEKGLPTILEAWSQLDGVIPLKILGTGPLEPMLQQRASVDPSIEVLGRQSVEEVLRIVGDATCLVMPAMWYENCPKTFIEAMAVGTPIVTSRLGAMAEMVKHEQTGLLVPPQGASELADTIRRMVGSPELVSNMRHQARLQFEKLYTAEQNHQQLMDIYQQAIVASAVQAGHRSSSFSGSTSLPSKPTSLKQLS